MKWVFIVLVVFFIMVPHTSACYAGPTDFDWMVENSNTILIGEIVDYDTWLQQDYRLFVKVTSYILDEPEKSALVIPCSGMCRSSPPPVGEECLFLLKENKAGGLEVIAGGRGVYDATNKLVQLALNLSGETKFTPMSSSPMHTLDMYYTPLLVLALLGWFTYKSQVDSPF